MNFRVTTYGESHGPAIGALIDGCPPQIKVSLEDIQKELTRRRPGQSSITSPRDEQDEVEILSGIDDGLTTGTPISLLIRNRDARPADYKDVTDAFRPSHADFTYQIKYGIRSKSGGGRASARETAARVAAGAVAKAVLTQSSAGADLSVEILAWVDSVAQVQASVDSAKVRSADVEASIVRCPDPDASKRMVAAIESARDEGDSLGGTIRAVARHVPRGLGEPVFDKLTAELAKAMMSLPATKGFEVGAGFSACTMKGSEHNDIFVPGPAQTITTRSNHSGGIQGGISNGETISIRVAFKPTATLRKAQSTVDSQGREVTLAPKGRHDPCVLPRAVPIVEAMFWLTLCDHFLRNRAQCGGKQSA